MSFLQGVPYLQGPSNELEVLLQVVQHGVPVLEGAQLEFIVESIAVLGQGHTVLVGLYVEAADQLGEERSHKWEGLTPQVIRAVHQKHHICILGARACAIKTASTVSLPPSQFRPHYSLGTMALWLYHNSKDGVSLEVNQKKPLLLTDTSRGH